MTAQSAPAEVAQPRDFGSFLLEQASGSTHAELSEGLHDLVERVIDTRKKGSLTLTVTVEPMKGGEDDQLVVTDKIVLKLPEHDRKASIFWADGGGNLQRTDPHQPGLFGELREVPAPAPAGVDPVTGEVK